MGFIALLQTYRQALLGGLLVTSELTAIAWFNGLFLGGLLGVAGARWPVLGLASRVTGFLVGSIPVIVILIWFYYPAQAIADVVVSPFVTASIALSLVNILIVADLVRPSISNLPQEYVVVGRVCGMNNFEVLREITFPLVIRQLLPSLLFSQVAIMQATLFASLISVQEIFRVTQQINAQVYQPVSLYTALALLFLMVSAPINAVALYLRSRFGRDLSEV